MKFKKQNQIVKHKETKIKTQWNTQEHNKTAKHKETKIKLNEI